MTVRRLCDKSRLFTCSHATAICDETNKQQNYCGRHMICDVAAQDAMWQCNPPRGSATRHAAARQHNGSCQQQHTYLRERLQQLAVDLSDGVERHVHFDQLRADACAPMRRCDGASVRQRNGATMQQCRMSATRLRHAHEPIAACGAVQACRASAAKLQRAPSLCMTAVACRLRVVCQQLAVA
jgi:hypothetical protein